MTRFLLIRHGETAWNADGRIQGHTDVELTEVGLEQARLAAERLRNEKIDVVYSSDLKRASATGEAVAKIHKLPVKTTPLLREANLGRWQGMTMQEVAEKYPKEYAAYSKDSINNRPPDAERLEDVIKRCRRFLDKVTELHPDATIAVACHGGTVRGLIAAALGAGPEIYRRIRADNVAITILHIISGKPLLVTMNDTCHLSTGSIGSGADQ